MLLRRLMTWRRFDIIDQKDIFYLGHFSLTFTWFSVPLQINEWGRGGGVVNVDHQHFGGLYHLIKNASTHIIMNKNTPSFHWKNMLSNIHYDTIFGLHKIINHVTQRQITWSYTSNSCEAFWMHDKNSRIVFLRRL